MKHVFVIHSPITYLVALSTVESLKLEYTEVMFICDGFYLPHNKISITDLNAQYSRKNAVLRVFSIIKKFNKTSVLDRMIDEFVGTSLFIAYVPVMRFVEKTVITHKKCSHFNFIEEGLAHYYKGETLVSLSVESSRDNWRWSITNTSLWKEMFFNMLTTIRGYNFRLRTLPFSYSCYVNFSNITFYGITESAFPMAHSHNKHLVKVPSGINLNTVSFNFDDRLIWVGDNGVDYYNYSSDLYLQGMEKGLIAYLKKREITEIYVKFHRGESQQMRKSQEQMFLAHGIRARIIPDDFILEISLMDAKNVTLCGVYSSLLFYANVMGHETFTIYEIVKNEYQKNLKGKNLDFFWERVKNIALEI